MSLSITDLFVIGLGFDIIGAVLLARGLLLNPSAIARLNTWGGLELGDTVDRCRNWVDAAFGLSFLVVGFVSQAAGYGAELGGVDARSGACRAYTATGLGITAVLLAYGIWHFFRDRLLKCVIAKVALAKPSGDEEDETGQWTRDRAARLLDLGEEAGWKALPAELEEGGAVDYAKRVFGIAIPTDLYRKESQAP